MNMIALQQAVCDQLCWCQLCIRMVFIPYLRPVSGCTSGCCETAAAADIAAAAAAEEALAIEFRLFCCCCCCLGLLTLVLLFANSSRIVWGRSGSNRTPCCNGKQRKTFKRCHQGGEQTLKRASEICFKDDVLIKSYLMRPLRWKSTALS